MLKIGILEQFLKFADGEEIVKYGKLLYTWNDVEEYNRKKNSIKISKELFNNIKLIEKNTILEKEIEKFRIKFNIPQNIDLQEIKDRVDNTNIYKSLLTLDFSKINFKKHNFNSIEELLKSNNDKKIPYAYYINRASYLGNIKENFHMPRWLNLYNLKSLFIANIVCVNMDTEYVSFSSSDNITPFSTVDIIIKNPKTTKHRLISYIEKNWELIQKEIKKLPYIDVSTISERDNRIWDLRQQGKKYSEIADIISNEFSEKDGDEAIIKTAYQRANKLISNIFYPRKNIKYKHKVQ